jgi:flagellar FliJ protein
VRRASAEDLALAHGSARSAGELQRTQLLLAHLDEHIAGAGTTLEQAKQVMARCVEEYHAAARQRSVLDRLRDRHHEVWRNLSNSAERKELDEIAGLRHRAQQPGTAEA